MAGFLADFDNLQPAEKPCRLNRPAAEMFSVYEHTADLGVRVEAGSLSELYAEAATGLFTVIAGDLGQVRRPLIRLERVRPMCSGTRSA